jgi:hypothetical protein
MTAVMHLDAVSRLIGTTLPDMSNTRCAARSASMRGASLSGRWMGWLTLGGCSSPWSRERGRRHADEGGAMKP